MEELELPRVSDIIAPFTAAKMASCPPDRLAYAAERGTQVHTHCRAELLGDFLPDPEPEIKAYVESFTRWRDDTSYEEICTSEQRFFDRELGFSGQADFIYRCGDKIILADIKTSAVFSPVWVVQLSAYAHLAARNGFKISEAVILHLKTKKNKKEEIIEFEAKEASTYNYSSEELNYNWETYFVPALKWYYLVYPQKKNKGEKNVN